MNTRELVSLAFVLFVGAATTLADPPRAEAVRKDSHGDPLPAGALVRMGTVRLRHGEAQLAFATDGKTLISAGHDRTVRFWNLANGEAMRVTTIPLPAPEQPGYMPIEMRQLTPDGGTLAVTSHEVLTLWDTATGKQLAEIAEQGHPPQTRRFRGWPDGRLAVQRRPLRRRLGHGGQEGNSGACCAGPRGGDRTRA
jgi:hypothetical protein